MNTPARLTMTLWVGAGVLVATALNALPLELLPGSRLLLGAFVYMPLLLVLPRRWAWMVAAIPMAITVPLLGHPFVLALSIAEAVWLSTSIRRWSTVHPVLLDLAFWAGLGLPAGVWLLGDVAAIPRDLVWLVLLKHLANQATAVAVAQFLCRYTRLLGPLQPAPVVRPRLRTLVSHFVFLLALAPLSIAGIGLSLIVQQRTADFYAEVMEDTGESIGREMDRHISDHFEDIRAAAAALGNRSANLEVSALLGLLRGTHPAFVAMFATDVQGRVLGCALAEQAAGSNFDRVDDQDFFHDAARSRQPHISSVFRDRRFGPEPVVAIIVPWFDAEGRLAGFTAGVLGVAPVRDLMQRTRRSEGLNYILAGRDGRIIAADAATGRQPMGSLRFDALAPLLQPGGAMLQYDDAEAGGSRQRFVACVRRSPHYGFVVIGRRPLLAPLHGVRWLNWLMLAMIAGVTVTGVAVVISAQRRISAPLEHFAAAAGAQHGTAVHGIAPPVDDLSFEVDQVFRSFNALAAQLDASYADLRRHNEQLDLRVAERTAELERARVQAEAANASKTDFLAMASHEIRTPMNAVIGLASALIEQTSDPAVAERLRTIHDAGERLVSVVNDLLDLARSEAGKLELHSAPVELGELLQQVEELFRLRAGQKGLRLEFTRRFSTPRWVETDGARLQQVLINLVGNAIKFTQHGTVRVTVERGPTSGDRHELRFAVADTGPGIAAEAQARLFQPYVQLGGPTSDGSAGSGLGLVISRQLLSLFGSTLQLKSQPGCGTELSFVVLVRSLPEPTLRARPRQQGAPGVSSLRVLAVDDNPTNQEVVRALLSGRCARLAIVGSTEEAILVLRSETFDVALLDLEMPGMDGYALCRAIATISGAEGTRNCRRVAVSAHARESVWAECAAAGFDAFVEKPLDREALLRAVSAPLPVSVG